MKRTLDFWKLVIRLWFLGADWKTAKHNANIIVYGWRVYENRNS